MPCVGDFNRSVNLMVTETHFRQNSTTKNESWMPRSSLVRGNERMRFQNQSDNLAGGLQYWCKQKHKATRNAAGKSRTTVQKILSKPSEKCQCDHCGGFVSEEARYRAYVTRQFSSVNKCAFQRQYCDVLGSCAECSLSRQRMNIVHKQNFEFPDIEVTPRRLVAPSLAEVMLADKPAEPNSYAEPGRSVLELPSISPDTLRYMRRQAGSTKQKRKTCIPYQDLTNKKYIEIRLPKI